jgi:L-fucose isomerase-like protein
MRTTFGVIVGNRGFFPDRLAKEGREEITKVMEEQGFNTIILSPEETKHGCVETWGDAQKCAKLFKGHREEIDGVIVSLPNFGDEKAIANALRLADLNVPVLIHAYPDEPEKMKVEDRRDSFCGKISVCNNLKQYGIPFTLTSLHTESPRSQTFIDDLKFFAGVCRVVKGLRGARIGAIGARPAPFNTVRYSEKLLEAYSISVETIDLSEILGQANRLQDGDQRVRGKVEEIRNYCPSKDVPEGAILKMAKLNLAISDWIKQNNLNAVAIQCWTALEEYYGIVPCAIMSMMSEALVPNACEVDVTGALSMYALQLASETPSAIVDWNNNYGDDPDKVVLFHCSNFPKSLLQNPKMSFQDILAGTVGKENTFGACIGRINPGPMTFLRITTDDRGGRIRAYVGEGEITEDSLETFGGWGVARINNLQRLLRHVTENGLEHHVAISRSNVARILDEVFRNYLGWEVYYHMGK